jgi:hypothetical protein
MVGHSQVTDKGTLAAKVIFGGINGIDEIL